MDLEKQAISCYRATIPTLEGPFSAMPDWHLPRDLIGSFIIIVGCGYVPIRGIELLYAENDLQKGYVITYM